MLGHILSRLYIVFHCMVHFPTRFFLLSAKQNTEMMSELHRKSPKIKEKYCHVLPERLLQKLSLCVSDGNSDNVSNLSTDFAERT